MRTTTFLLIVCCILLFSGQSGSAQDFALAGGKVYTSPASEPLNNGTVLVKDGKITAVGPVNQISIPSQIPVIDGRGLTIMAGFWNSHVHFIEEKWQNAAEQPSRVLSGHLQEMLTQHGIVHAYETGLDADLTVVEGDPDSDLSALNRIRYVYRQGNRLYSTAPLL